MDTTTNYYTSKREIPRDQLPHMKDVPTPDIVILDLLPIMRDYKELVKSVDEFEVCIVETLTNIMAYINEEDKAEAGLSEFVSKSYDMFLDVAQKKRIDKPVSSMYEELAIEQQAYDSSMAAELLGTHLIAQMRLFGMYHNNRAFYQFTKMEDKYSPLYSKSDVFFFPY